MEWANAIAPLANIVLVEANDGSYFSSLFPAVATADGLPGVSVVSMNFSSAESPIDATFYDSYFFHTPSGHQGVTFVASTGDTGPRPAIPPFVQRVGGGRHLAIAQRQQLRQRDEFGAAVAAASASIESQPSYQQGLMIHNGGSTVNPAGMRTIPDVAFDADPSTGGALYDSYNGGSAPWMQTAGTSLAAPCWAGLIALANQMRVSAGLTTLDGPSQTLPRLYQLPAADFHDITSGTTTAARTTPRPPDTTSSPASAPPWPTCSCPTWQVVQSHHHDRHHGSRQLRTGSTYGQNVTHDGHGRVRRRDAEDSVKITTTGTPVARPPHRR